jgi:zinc transport system substrate-binding protein
MLARLSSIFTALLIMAIILLSLGLASCNSTRASSGKPVVLCTIFAYYDAARAIAGDRMDVRILIPAGGSPHDYETTVNDKVLAAQANLYVKNGLALDDQFDKLLDGSRAKILNVSEHIPKDLFLTTQELSLDEAASTAPATRTAGAAVNPHIWLDPQIQIKATELIRDAIIDLDPADRQTFEKNAAAYTDDLNKLDADFKSETATFKNKDFIGFHSAYEYLARRYGLHQIASIEELPGSEITIDQSQKIIKLIQQRHIKYIAVENAFSGSSAKMIEQQTGVKEIVLQPLETYDNAADTYVKYMRANLQALKTALNG